MSRRDQQRLVDYLGHILQAIERIERYTEDMSEVAFLDDEMTQDAVIRNFEIIGEASNSLSDSFKAAHSEVAWRDIGALRILLAHHYHRIDLDQVWEIAAVSVPELVRHLPTG